MVILKAAGPMAPGPPMGQPSGASSQNPSSGLVEFAPFSARPGIITSLRGGVMGNKSDSVRSLDLLRQNVQRLINRDIDQVIQTYLKKFFSPGVDNIRSNLGQGMVDQADLNQVCIQVLEEAKSMYASAAKSDTHSTKPDYKRKSNDADDSPQLKRLMLTPPSNSPSTRWDPARINNDTLFILGAKANKVMGFGQTRGRLYMKHPELFKYPGDSTDKEWLCKSGLMPSTGGRAYLMLVEDILRLMANRGGNQDGHDNSEELVGFRAPPFLLSKVQAFMAQQQQPENSRLSSKIVMFGSTSQ